MPRLNAPFVSFNSGLVSKLALGRVDVGRLRFAAELQTNWAPRVIGPMSLRNGLGYHGTTKDNLKTHTIEFIFAGDDTALIELIGDALVFRVRVDDQIVTRNAVATVIDEGDFDGTGTWTLTDSGGATSSITAGVLTLSAVALGSRTFAEQQVTIGAGDTNTEHGIRIVVNRGPVTFQIGTTSEATDVLGPHQLGPGVHSLTFTPGGASVFVQLGSAQRRDIIVESIQIEPAGAMELPIPWDADDLEVLRTAQSGDVVYIACNGFQQRKIERRSATSWSIVLYQTQDGPFRANPSADLLLTPSATSGNITLAASDPFFTASQIGSLIRLFQNAQERTSVVGAEDTFTESIRVTGVGVARSFTLTIAGTWTGTITLQRSFDSPDAGFADVSPAYTANTAATINDAFDNSIVWYRIGFKTGDYGSGTATLTLSYPGGGGAGIVRITAVATDISASAEVLSPLSSLNATRDWLEGDWSDKYGYPSAVRLFEGRLWWLGRDRVWASVSDAFESFDIEKVGDAGPINRSIGYGPVEVINWALDLQRLLFGTAMSEPSVRSTAFDQPLSPTNFSIKDASTQGSANIQAVKVDSRGIYVQKSKRRLFQLLYSVDEQDYGSNDLTALLPDLDSDFVQLAVQRQPDTRIHALRADGTVLILVFEPKEEVICFYKVETAGAVERIAVLPGTEEDRVYYYVRRTVNSLTVRYVEKFALTSECQGGTLNKQADAFIVYDGPLTSTIPVPHLQGKTVVVWGNGKDLGIYPVTGGQITGLSEAVTQAVVGMSYQALFKSAKLAYGAQLGTALSQKKKLDHLGLILHNTHAQGLEFSGRDFDHMDPMPLTIQGAPIDPDLVYEEFDEPMTPLPGSWTTDSRLYLRATAPRPATVLAGVIGMRTNETG